MVDTNSLEWLQECHARAVANMPKNKRIEYMKRYAKKHGSEKGEQLRARAKEQWQKIQDIKNVKN